MSVNELKLKIENGAVDNVLIEECAANKDELGYRKERLVKACDNYKELFGDGDVIALSVGGRSEISGNHTDHNKGKVIAAAISLDIIAVAAPTDDGVVSIKSDGYEMDVVPPEDIASPCEKNFFKSSAIIAGMEKAFLNNGYKVGGFNAYTTSNVFKGSGLSSSAAFEVMVGNILNHLYNNGKVPNVEIAKMAQFAENEYFGKPCGLMDQTACAVGGFITIDFENSASPVIEKMDFDLTREGYDLCIVDTGGNHSDLNEDYASVPAEMKGVAKLLGKEVLRELTEEDLLINASLIREKMGDRALLRAFHFMGENKRVEQQCKALSEGDLDGFFKGVLASGNSSYKYLQNVYTVKNVKEQGLSLALCLTEKFLADKKAAYRVHGGGFAGTIQAFVPHNETPAYKEYIEKVFGKGKCYILNVRKAGAIKLI